MVPSRLSIDVVDVNTSLNRTSLYYKLAPPSEEEIRLKHRIDELYTAHPYYGSRRVAAQLRREGVAANRKAVQRHMREMCIAGIAPGPNRSRRAPAHRVYPYLLGSVASSYPDHPPGHRHHLHPAAGRVDVPGGGAGLILALRRGLGAGPEPGVPFVLRAARWALDNIFTERLRRTVKYDEFYLHSYTSLREARRGLTRSVDFYHHGRLHQALAYRTPHAQPPQEKNKNNATTISIRSVHRKEKRPP